MMSHGRTSYFRSGPPPLMPTSSSSSQTPPADPRLSRPSNLSQAHYPSPSPYNSTTPSYSHSPRYLHSYSGPRPCTNKDSDPLQHTCPLGVAAAPLGQRSRPCTGTHNSRLQQSVSADLMRNPAHRGIVGRPQAG